MISSISGICWKIAASAFCNGWLILMLLELNIVGLLIAGYEKSLALRFAIESASISLAFNNLYCAFGALRSIGSSANVWLV